MDRPRTLIALFVVSIIAMDSYAAQSTTPDTSSSIEFGNNLGDVAFDGQCHDPRLEDAADSSRMAAELDATNMFRDAADCYDAYQQGAIRLRSAEDAIDFGSDSGVWASNYICEDSRFEIDPRLGDPDVALPPTTPNATRGDATDCRRAFIANEIWLLDPDYNMAFGTDSSRWAYDGECDDPRFEGDGMAELLLRDNIRHDATDCRTGLVSGRVTFTRITNHEITFGDDRGAWAYDGECDDPRFEGEDMATTPRAQNVLHDATDCYRALRDESIMLHENIDIDGIDFGTDLSQWAYDGECDDPRFEGEGMANSLLKDDRGRDATDCRRAYKSKKIVLK